jgi:8-oxo-dGTP pyrophosphatase MutT (NUDIX family)
MCEKRTALIWNLPGGRVEPEETPVEAAMRELQEETGLAPEYLMFLYSGVFVFGGTQWVGYFYLSGPSDGKPSIREPDKCAGLKFVAQHKVNALAGPRGVFLEPIAVSRSRRRRRAIVTPPSQRRLPGF